MSFREARPDEIHEGKRQAGLRSYYKRKRKNLRPKNYSPPIARKKPCDEVGELHDFEMVPVLGSGGYYRARCKRCHRFLKARAKRRA